MHYLLRWIWWVLDGHEFSLPQLKVYLYLLYNAREESGFEPYCQTSVASIARDCRFHTRTVQNATADLQKKKFIYIEAQRTTKGGPSPNIYRLIRFPSGWQAPQQPPAQTGESR
jgi:hypothetical protein